MKNPSLLFRFLAQEVLLLLSLVWTPMVSAQGLSLWDGPLIAYSQPTPEPTLAANQDRLTDNVWLTRGTSQGLFNAASEGSYSHFASPAGTEWAYGQLADYASLTYNNWETWAASRPPDTVGQPAVLHLISDDIYLSIQFTSWGGFGGGFSYMRSTPAPVPEPAALPILLLGLLAAGCLGRKMVRPRPAT